MWEHCVNRIRNDCVSTHENVRVLNAIMHQLGINVAAVKSMVPCNFEQLQARHVVFGRACGAASTMSNIEKSNCIWCRSSAEIPFWKDNQHMKNHSQSLKTYARKHSIKATINRPETLQKVREIRQKTTPGEPLGPRNPTWAKSPQCTLAGFIMDAKWTPQSTRVWYVFRHDLKDFWEPPFDPLGLNLGS